MFRSSTYLIPLLLFACWTSAGAAEEEAADVFSKVQGAVVSLRNIEGSGTGMLIGSDGLILTNAHVVSSPLPFTCEVNIAKGGREQTVTFQNVKVLGVHPTKDMALVRIDPKEHGGKLRTVTLHKKKAQVGQRVYAIGNPAGGGGVILNKTITMGILSGADRVLEGVSYYQVDASINPGNSGGPLVDRDGMVVGIVTLKFTDVENVGFAIPLYDLDTKEFVPQSKRKGDPAAARELAKIAEKYADEAFQMQLRGRSNEDPNVMLRLMIAARYFHLAISEDPSNPVLFSNLGNLLRQLDNDEAATAYLLYAVELDPWHEKLPGAYRELGFSLVKQGKKEEGLAAWKEGTSKFPKASSKTWEDMAIFYHQDKPDPLQAGVCAAAALEVADRDLRRDVAEGILSQSKRALNPKQQEELDEEVRSIRRKIEGLQKAAERGRSKKVDYLVKEFRDYVVANGVMNKTDGKGDIPQLAAADIGDDSPGRRSKQKKSTEDSEETKETSEPIAATIDVVVPDGSINLLSRIRSTQDSLVGTWTIEEKTLLAPFKQKALLAFNYDAPAQYDLTLIVERRSNNGELVVAFPANTKRAAMVVDGERGSRTWLSHDDQNAHLGSLLQRRQPTTLVIQVRNDSLRCLAQDGSVLLSAPLPSDDSSPGDWDLPVGQRFCLGSDLTRFVFHKFMLTPVE